MSRRRGADQSGASDAAERELLKIIKDRKDQGIYPNDLKSEAKLPVQIFTKSLKSLLTTKKLIKKVKNVRGRDIYMAVEFEPSKEVSGGAWYNDGHLDMQLITTIRRACCGVIRKQTVATIEGVHNEVKRCVTFPISIPEVKEILNALTFDDEILEVKSTGSKEYHPIPIGTVCYRIPASGMASKGVEIGGFASIPCAACPRITVCTPGGVISPSTCVYYTKWLGIDF